MNFSGHKTLAKQVFQLSSSVLSPRIQLCNTKLSPWWFNSSVISLKSIENFSNCDPQALFTHNTFKDILVISLLEAYKIEEHTLGVIVRP